MSQPEYVNLAGVATRDRRIDETVFHVKSYNPDYSELEVKVGVNPVAADGYEVISKQVNFATGVTTLVCGKKASAEYKADLATKATIEAPVAPQPTGTSVEVESIKNTLESQSTVLREGTSAPQEIASRQAELAGARAQQRDYSLLTTYAPHLVATKGDFYDFPEPKALPSTSVDATAPEVDYTIFIWVAMLFVCVIVSVAYVYDVSNPGVFRRGWQSLTAGVQSTVARAKTALRHRKSA